MARMGHGSKVRSRVTGPPRSNERGRRLRYWLATRLIRSDIHDEEQLAISSRIDHDRHGTDDPKLERYWMGRLTAMQRLKGGHLGDGWDG